MNAVAKGAVALWPAILLGASLLDARAQLAVTQVDGLQISVAGILRTSASDCALRLKFAGEKAQKAVGLQQLNFIQAVDDTGAPLVQTDHASIKGLPTGPWKQGTEWFWLVPLKGPSSNAKTIRRLEAEVTFLERNELTAVLTDFMSHPGEVLHQTLLDKYQIAIRCVPGPDASPNGQNSPPQKAIILRSDEKTRLLNCTVSVEIDDSQNKLVSMEFQKPDGRFLSPTNTRRAQDGTHKTWTYVFSEVPPPLLNLVVDLNISETAQKVAFGFENIRLPWLDPPDFQVTTSGFWQPKGAVAIDPNARVGFLGLKFAGGQLTNALGIRKVWIDHAEDDAGQDLEVDFHVLDAVDWLGQLDRLEDFEGTGRKVTKQIPLRFQSNKGSMLRVLHGEAELILRNAMTDGRVAVKDFINRAGEPLEIPRLGTNRVKLGFVGPMNFAATYAEICKKDNTNGWVALSAPTGESASGPGDSLQFSLDDPDSAVVDQLAFVDKQGQPLSFINWIRSGNFRVYRFTTMPPPETQLVVCLAVPASIERVPFKLENIPLR